MEHDVLNKNRACQLNKHEMTCEHATTNLCCNEHAGYGVSCVQQDFRNRYRSEWNGLFFVVENNHVLQHCPETFLRETKH